jgi:predicted Zn finger-like uncharacterized protein
MKIVCDSCSTKYSIADEKVRGKVFKIKCKKCGHIIVVKGAEDTGAPSTGHPASGFDQKETRVFDYSGQDGGGEAVWHLVIGGEQVGPMSPADVRARWQAGEIDAETFSWKEGMGDWQRLADIDELNAAVQGAGAAPADPAAAAEPQALFGSSGGAAGGGGGDLFGGGAGGAEAGGDLFAAAAPAGGDFGAPASAAMPSARRSLPKDDLFAGSGGGDAFAGAGGGAGGGSVPEVKSMTAQRNENSVLFSLNNLAALASNEGSRSPMANPSFKSGGGTEGSGLIDIRAMAAMTLKPGGPSGPGASNASSQADDLPVFGASSFAAPAGGVLLPSMPQPQSNKLIIMLAAVIGVLLIAAVVIVVVVLKSNKTVPTVAAVNPQTLQPTQALPTPSLPPNPVTPNPATPIPVATNPDAEVAATEPATPPTAKPEETRTVKATKPDRHHHEVATAETRTTAKAPASPQTKTEKCDDMGCALDPSMPCCKKKPAVVKGGDDNLPETLTASDIKSGIAAVKGRASQCGAQHDGSGIVKVKFSINGSGQVTTAKASGPNAALNSCLEKAVKGAHFKRWQGPSISVTYPFAM